MARVDLFLCGDVMTGRGIDQILPHPSAPKLYEPHIHDARDYVRLAERESGPIARPVSYAYVWGDALDELRRRSVHARIVNLETSITLSEEPWPKGINYRMHPDNVPCLATAEIDVCVLANNHVLDWGRRGLKDTLDALRGAGIAAAGAGCSSAEAEAVVAVDVTSERRVLVVGVADRSSGVPPSWSAKRDAGGVALLPDLGDDQAKAIGERLARVRRPGDLAVVSIHWGSNWGYEVPDEHVRFAHALVECGVDVVHGHSSHHPRPIELHRGKPILYGCGDLLSDYEGISGYEPFRADLVLMYFLSFDDGELAAFGMSPMRIRKLRLERASQPDAVWLTERLGAVSARFGTEVRMTNDGSLVVTARAA